MDEDSFQQEKRRILGQHAQWKCFERMRAKIEVEMRRPGHSEQCPFSFSDADKCCIEWGLPNDSVHHELAMKVVSEYLLTRLGWKFRVRNIIEPNLLPDHHGIGVRIDDFKSCRQWSGILGKTYDAVGAAGGKPPNPFKNIDKPRAPPKKEGETSPRKEEKKKEKEEKPKKSLKEKMGMKKGDKKKDDGGDEKGGNNNNNNNDDDDYFH